jgi:hypothetical protein
VSMVRAMSEQHRPEHEPDRTGSAKSEHDAALEAAHDLGCELVFGHWIVSCFVLVPWVCGNRSKPHRTELMSWSISGALSGGRENWAVSGFRMSEAPAYLGSQPTGCRFQPIRLNNSPAQQMQRSPRCGLAALSDRVRCPALGLALSATEGTFA